MQKISEIASVRNGFSIRGKVHDNPDGQVCVIQMKDLELNYTKIGLNAYRIERSKTVQKHLLMEGEVLLLARGTNNKALCYAGEYKQAVAASAFFVIHLNDAAVLPAYLAWYLNQKPIQQEFQKLSAGTMIRNLNKSGIDNLSIPIPSLEKQKEIVRLYELWQQEQHIIHQIIEKKNKLIEHLLLSQTRKSK